MSNNIDPNYNNIATTGQQTFGTGTGVFTYPQVTWTYPNIPNIYTTSTTSSLVGTSTLEAILQKFAKPGETVIATLQRVVLEFEEMRQMLRELAVLTDNHGEGTVCL